MDKWFYAEGSERKGPVSAEELIAIIKNGQIGPESYVWKKGYEGWVKLKTVSEFSVAESKSPVAQTVHKGPDWQNIQMDRPLDD